MRLSIAVAWLLVYLPSCALASAPYERRGNSVTFSLTGGWAKIEWVNAAAIRFCRGWERPAGCPDLADREAVAFTERDDLDTVELRSRELVVRVEKSTGRVEVATGDGLKLLGEIGVARRMGADVVVQFRSSLSEKFHGLGMRDGPVVIKGTRVRTRRAFLFSTRGYGLYFPAPVDYEFDLGGAESSVLGVRAHDSRRLEYFFYEGGSPKEVFEAHLAATNPVERLNTHDIRIAHPSAWTTDAAPIGAFGPAGWDSLRATVRALINGSLSAVLLPAWDLAPWRSTSSDLHRRASQLAAFLPLLGDSTASQAKPPRPALDAAAAVLRARLSPFLLTYALEAHDRGFPVIHPLPVQFPDDEHGRNLDDEFLFGDEILVAPALAPTSRRKVYLPMGRWTELSNNTKHKGKQTIEIDVPESSPALFVKNGSLLPLAAERSGDPMELHYFPALGGEFFLAEEGLWYPTQLHASPAGDYYRLETESKKDRDYEWIVHHLPRPSKVVEGDDVYLEIGERTMLANGCWYYDTARGNLHVRQHARAGADHIINIAF
jgi:hypothetical protein